MFGGVFVLIWKARRIAHKTTELRKLDKVGDCRQPICCGEFGHALELDKKDRISDEEHAVGAFSRDSCKDIVEVGYGSHL